jgi:intracellular sulfur oxidation DsrE/DsrF family protein
MRILIAAAVLLGSVLVFGPALAETELADPKPSFDNPRRIMLQLTSDDPKVMNNILYNAINLQKFYGIDNVQIAVIGFGAGMKAFYEKDSPVADRIKSQLKYGIEFVGCGNTMTATHRDPSELIPGVSHVTAGIAEIVERKLSGWIYIRP